MLALLFSRKQVRIFSETVRENGRPGLGKFLRECTALGLVLASATGLGLGYAGFSLSLIVLGMLVAGIIPLIARCLLELYLFEQRKQEKEHLVADALLQAALFPPHTSIDTIIRYLSRSDYGLLSREFSRALQEMEKGASVKIALQNMSVRNRSKIITRACTLLIQGYESGADLQSLFSETADDLLETHALIRERRAALVVEKYTLLFAGGLIVPGVLGMISGVVQGFSFASLPELDFGLPTAERTALLSAALLANQVYIAEYALLAAFFVAQQEQDAKKAVVYAVVLLPLSFAAYALGAGNLW